MTAWNAQCVVVAEHWPSWSFALHALGVQKLETVLPVAGSQAIKEVMETSVGGTMIHCPPTQGMQRYL